MRPYGVFLIVTSVSAFGSSCAYTLNLVFQIGVVGLGPLGLVLVGTVLEVVYLAAQLPMGVLADRRGRRLPILLGVFLIGAGTVLQGAVPTLAATLAGTALWGAGAACFDGAFEAWAADEIAPARLGPALARGAQAGQAATVAGMLAAAGLSALNPALPLLAGGAAWLALGGLLLPALTSTFRRPSGPAPSAAAGLRTARRTPRLRALALATVFVALGREGFDRLGQSHMWYSLPPGPPALWLGGLAIATTLAAIPLTRLLQCVPLPGAGRGLAWLQAAQLAVLALFALTGSFPVAAAASGVAGALRSAVAPLWTAALVASTEPRTRATVLSAVGMLEAGGEIAGGPPAGWIGRRFSVARALLACAVVSLPSVAFLALADRAEPPGATRREAEGDAEAAPAKAPT